VTDFVVLFAGHHSKKDAAEVQPCREVDAALSVEGGHDIAADARARVMQRHRVLNVMRHVDP
jgi:divalent metal cation (Fe/Co/Zn/Cd) transporter